MTFLCFFYCAKCRCSLYVIRDELLEGKPFSLSCQDGGVCGVGAVRGCY